MHSVGRLASHAEASCSGRCDLAAVAPYAGGSGARRRQDARLLVFAPWPIGILPQPPRRALAGTTHAAAATILAPVAQSDGNAGVRELVTVPVPDSTKRNPDGSPVIHWVQLPAGELRAAEAAAQDATKRLQEAEKAMITGLNLHRLDMGTEAHEAPSAQPQRLELPGDRIITDPVELNLIGRGLPVMRGPECPEAYWEALAALDAGHAVPVPRPHPKFAAVDLARIATSGPRFSDVVLQHAERLEDGTAHAYNYVPAPVLGDWGYAVEPEWAALPQISVPQFWAGLRARNWAAGRHLQRDAQPWRVQLFRCGDDSITAWPGLRALVTQRHSAVDAPAAAAAPAAPYPGRFWVDMPTAGPDTPLDATSLPDPGAAGYGAVLSQLYQGYAQRVPRAARDAAARDGFVAPGALPYSCPGDRLLDMSWHYTPQTVTNPLARFLINPNMPAALKYLEQGINESGIWEMKYLRDSVNFLVGPDPIEFDFYFDPNNAGPLYFLVCLTLGIVVPALRRNRILDIKTLEEDPGAAMEFARSKSTARKEGLTGVEFKDVAGLGPILGEVVEVVEFLKDPKTFSKLGARPPKGILMEGDPGTGKTLLAKALAGEAMVPFYQMAGTEFTEGIVGLGAARVRDLFKRARANAPCVIFVDELDALGLKRAEGDGSGKVNEEREQTLNQLLTEMDGFTPDTGVVFIGATNRADLLDPALMRPGRFDRKIRMPKPDTEGRYDILQLHLRNKKIAADVDLMQLSRDLPGLVGADLANIVNEAQMCAVREGRDTITARDMYAGVDRFTQGERRQPLSSEQKLPVTVFAAKEAAVALVVETLRARHGRVEPVERVSIQPKGRSYSRTLFARGTDEDYQVMTKGRLMDRIRVALAGHVGVRIVLGQETNFSIPDIQRACRMAHKLVFYYCMSDLGLTTWGFQAYSTDFMIGSQRPRKVVSTDAMDEYADWPTRNEDFRFDPPDPSDPTWHRYTDEVRRIIRDCYIEVWDILQARRGALWAAVSALSAQRELLGSEMRDIFDAHPDGPRPADAAPAPLESMVLFTDKAEGRDKWPFGIPWLDDAYPTPYWVREQRKGREVAAQTAGVAP